MRRRKRGERGEERRGRNKEVRKRKRGADEMIRRGGC